MTAALVAIAWLVGIGVAAFSDGDWVAISAAASLFAAGTFAWLSRRRRSGKPRSWRPALYILPLTIVAVFLAGWRYDSAPTPDLSLARLNDGPEVQLRGMIADEPEERETTVLYRLNVREVFEGGAWHEQSGAVLVRGPVAPKYEYGDLLELEAKLDTPPTFPDFDYRDYLATRGITSLVSFPKVASVQHGHGDWLRSQMIDVKSDLTRALSDVLPEPHASLAAGILYGERSSIPDDLRDDMRDTGTSHLVAVSGQNVSIVAAMVMAVLSWVMNRRKAAWISLLTIGGYVLLVGLTPAVVRAAIMGGVFVIAAIAGRQKSSGIALAYAATAMTAYDPTIIDDVSFQLSFAATLGLATFASPVYQRLTSAANARPVVANFALTRPAIELFSVTIAAVLFTMPVSAVYFGQISVVAPVANLFVVPAFLFVGVTSGACAAIDLAVPQLAPVLSWIAYPFAEYMIETIRLFARIPAASVTIGGITRWHASGFYAGLVALTWWLTTHPAAAVEAPPKPKKTPRRLLVTARGVAVLVALIAGVTLIAVSQPERGRLSVTFLDVGQGDAILIEGPHGHRVLVDGGPGSLPITRALARNMPFDDRRIDLVVLTHAQSDHMTGLVTVLDRYDVGAVIDTALPGETALYDAWESAIRDSGAPVVTADRGQSIDLGDGAMLQVLGPDQDDPLLASEDLNSASTVVRLSMGEASFLLTGDLDDVGEAALIRSGTNLASTVLKVGHHGSKTSSTAEFVARVQPMIDVIEVGAANSFGQPAEETIDRLAGDLLYRTDRDGDVTVTTDGSRIWVER